MTGRLTEWQDDRGFGFITPVTGGERVFAHISVFGSRSRRPQRGDVVTFVSGRDERGRPRASDVRIVEATPPPASGGATWLVPVVVICAVAALAGFGRVPWWLPLLYAGTSLAAFLAYGWDKASAEADRRRTPEDTLHLFGLIGGWPGAWVAQKVYRHKTRKASFRATFWITVFVNLGALTFIAAGGDVATILEQVAGSPGAR